MVGEFKGAGLVRFSSVVQVLELHLAEMGWTTWPSVAGKAGTSLLPGPTGLGEVLRFLLDWVVELGPWSSVRLDEMCRDAIPAHPNGVNGGAGLVEPAEPG